MTYTVTLQADTRDALAGKIATLAAEWAVDKTDEQPTPTKPQAHPDIGTDEPPPERPVEDAPQAKAKAKTRKKATPAPAPAPDTDRVPAIVSAEALRDQLMAYAQENGNTKARELVAAWGKVSDVPEEHRNRLYQEAGGTL